MSNSNEDQISNVQWQLIVRRMQQGRCIPFLGAGVNRGGSEEETLPLGSELALSILQLMAGDNTASLSDVRDAIRFQSLDGQNRQRPNVVLPDPGEKWLADLIHTSRLERYGDLMRVSLQDLGRVSLRYRWEIDEDDFIAMLQELIPDTERRPSRVLMGLAALPFKLLVTTNYDRLMERAMELLHLNDIKEPARLLARLKADVDSVTITLRAGFSEELKARLHEFDPAAGVPEGLLQQAVDEVNRQLQEKRLHHLGETSVGETGRRKLVGVRPPTDSLKEKIGKKPQSHLEVRRSRRLLEFVYAEELKPHRPFEVIVQPIRGFEGEEVERTTNRLADLNVKNGVTLFKLHGTFEHGQFDPRRRPVITEEDYVEFMTYVMSDTTNRLITSRFQSSTLLFLGYGLEDWTFRVLFKSLIENLPPSKQRKSFAIQKNPSEFWKKYWARKGVEIFNMDTAEFAEQLELNYKKYAEEPAPQLASGGGVAKSMKRGPVKGG
jgi:hypothetical protein